MPELIKPTKNIKAKCMADPRLVYQDELQNLFLNAAGSNASCFYDEVQI